MLRRTAMTVAVLCALAMFSGESVLAQQSKAPRPILSKVLPHYPDLARSMKLEGSVKVTALVAADGSVKSVDGMGGHPLLLKAAEDAISKWRWAAAPQQTQELVELRFHPN